MIRPYQIITNSVNISAPAKINLFLKVGGRDESNFHRIKTLIAPISLADSLLLEVSASETHKLYIQADFDQNLQCHNEYILCQNPDFKTSLADISSKDGLIARAVQMTLEHFVLPQCEIKVTLTKSIPLQSGLGGGSADAAATLLALSQIFNLSFDELVKIGSTLGSDVPSLLYRKAVFAWGKGEKVKVVEEKLKQLHLIIIKPPQSISTAQAYRALGRAINLTEEAKSIWSLSSIAHLLYQNDFTEIAFQIVPALIDLSAELKRFAPDALFLAGSGSALVSIFPCHEVTKRVLRDLQRLKKSGVFLTQATLLDA